MEDEEALESRAVIGNVTDFVEHLVNELLSNSVVTASIVVRRVLLARDHLLWMEEVTVRTGADLIDNVRFKVDVDGTGNVLPLACKELFNDIFRAILVSNLPVSEKKVLKP